MQPGSIVELTKELTLEDIRLLMFAGLHITRGVPYVVEKGPIKDNRFWINCAWITLQEFPGSWLNSDYFSELEPPQEIEIEYLLPEKVPAQEEELVTV